MIIVGTPPPDDTWRTFPDDTWHTFLSELSPSGFPQEDTWRASPIWTSSGRGTGTKGPEWFRPARHPEPLETEGKTGWSGSLIFISFTKVGGGITTSFGGVESFISFALLRTNFFFFFAGTPAGGEDAERLQPGAFRKRPSCLFSSRSLRRTLRARASALRAFR